jgi:hypothetical protein
MLSQAHPPRTYSSPAVTDSPICATIRDVHLLHSMLRNAHPERSQLGTMRVAVLMLLDWCMRSSDVGCSESHFWQTAELLRCPLKFQSRYGIDRPYISASFNEVFIQRRSGFADFHGSRAIRHLASMRCCRVFSSILKLSSRGPIGMVLSIIIRSSDSVEELALLDLLLVDDFRLVKPMMVFGGDD